MLAVFLDIESTGLDPQKHRVIDIAFTVVDLSAREKKASYRAVIRQSQEVWDARDPNSTKINGFVYEEVEKGKDLALVQRELKEIFKEYQIVRGHAVFICQNPAFDRTFFSQIIPIPVQEEIQLPYHWLDLASMYFGITVKSSLEQGIAFPENFSVSKNSIAERFQLAPEAEPHKALGGVNHLIKCYEALFGVHFADF